MVEQVGGNHYDSEGMEHWDLMNEMRVGYMESSATKYVSRWRKKGGLEDLRKALSFVEKILSSSYSDNRSMFYWVPDHSRKRMRQWFEDCGMEEFERGVCREILCWDRFSGLEGTAARLRSFIESEEQRVKSEDNGLLPDGGGMKHPFGYEG